MKNFITRQPPENLLNLGMEEELLTWFQKDGNDKFANLKLILNNLRERASVSETAGEEETKGEVASAPINQKSEIENRFIRKWIQKKKRHADERNERLILDTESLIPLLRLENLVEALGEIDNPRFCSEIIKTWLEREENNLDADQLKEFLDKNYYEDWRALVATVWLREEKQHPNAEQLVTILDKIPNHLMRSNAAMAWLRRDENNPAIDQLAIILQRVFDHKIRLKMVNAWLEKDQNTPATTESLTKFYEIFIKRLPKTLRDRISEDFAQSLNDRNAHVLLNNLGLIQCEQDRISNIDRLIETLHTTTDVNKRSNAALDWLKKDDSNPTAEQLLEILQSIFCNQPHQANRRAVKSYKESVVPTVHHLVIKWLKRERDNSSAEQVASIADIFPYSAGSRIIEEWFEMDGNNLHSNQLNILTDKLSNKQLCSSALECWIEKQTDKNEKTKALIRGLQTGVLSNKYNTGEVFEFIENLCLEGIIDKETLFVVANQLYEQLEESKVDLVELAINKRFIDPSLPKDFEGLKNFICNIRDENLTIDFIRNLHYGIPTLVEGRIQLTPPFLTKLQVLEIAIARSAESLSSLTKCLKGKSLEETLTERGLAEVVADFPDQEITPSGLLFYYLFTDSAQQFTKLCRPEILTELRKNYRPQHTHSYVSPPNYGTIFALTNHKLPQVAELCDAILPKMERVMGLSPEVIATYQINFGESDTRSDEKKKEINEEFKDLLGAESVRPKKVAEFFQKLLQLEGEINSAKYDDLHKFFVQNKAQLATLFARESGVEKFTGCFSSLSDGCFANIGTQLNIVLSRELVSDPHCAVLYSCLASCLVAPILRETGKVHDAPNPLNGITVRSYYFSPLNLFDDLIREFLDFPSTTAQREEGEVERKGAVEEQDSKEAVATPEARKPAPKLISNPWDVINIGKSENEKEALFTALTNMGDKDFDRNSSKLAVCVILEKTVPTLFENYPFFEEHRKWYKSVLEEAKDIEAEEAGVDTAAELVDDRTSPSTEINLAKDVTQITSSQQAQRQ